MATKMLGKVVAGAALGGASLLVFTPGIAFADGAGGADGHHNRGKVIAKPHVVKPGHEVKLIEVCTEEQEHPFVWSKVTGKIKLAPKTEDSPGQEAEDSYEHDNEYRSWKKSKEYRDYLEYKRKKEHDPAPAPRPSSSPEPSGSPQPSAQPQPSEQPAAPNGRGGGIGDEAGTNKTDDKKAAAGKPAADATGKPAAEATEEPAAEEGKAEKTWTGEEGSQDWAAEEDGESAAEEESGKDWAAEEESDKDWSGKDWAAEEDSKDWAAEQGEESASEEGKDWSKERFAYWASVTIPWDAEPGTYELKGSCGEGELVVLPKGWVDGGDGGAGAGTDRGLAASGVSMLGAATLGGLVLLRRRRNDALV